MADQAPITKLDEHGVPHCTGARCPNRTPKDRRAITGEAIESTCQPAVRAMAAELVELRRTSGVIRPFSEASRG